MIESMGVRTTEPDQLKQYTGVIDPGPPDYKSTASANLTPQSYAQDTFYSILTKVFSQDTFKLIFAGNHIQRVYFKFKLD